MHLGPYVECAYKKEKKTVKRIGCVNASCARFHKKNTETFCSVCGQKTEGFAVKVDADKPHIETVTEERLSRACNRSYDSDLDHTFGIPNRWDESPITSDMTIGDEAESVDVLCRDIDAEVAWFKREYATSLDKCREAYASVEVKWGLLQWYT
jgi:hypothetical protein